MLLDRLAAPGSQQGTGDRGIDAIDLVLPMKGPYGSELNLIETARILRRKVPARIWSTIQPHPHLLELDPSIQMITPDNIPSGDTMAFMGLFAEPPGWLERTRPRRIVLRYNVWHVSDLLRWLGAASRTSAEEIDVVYPSHALKAGLGLDGPVIQTFIDFDHFADRRPASEVLSVGRLSRDEIGKHHPQDPALYRALVGLGLEVRIMGGTKLAPFVQQHERLKLLASLAVPAREFIHGLGLFYYRTGSFYEAFGRVVMEAMASGLPVVCHKAGGYAEMIDSGENGFLFETSEEAVETISRLRGDGNLVRRIGEAARETVRAMHSRAYEDRLIAFLTGSEVRASP
jgi:glycosyltransferase involved in cell wall biosynthesis